MGRAYQGAFEAVIAVVVAGVLGAWADRWLGTTPWLLVLGVVLGFGAFVLRLVRMLEWMNQASARAAPDAGASAGPGTGTGGPRGPAESGERDRDRSREQVGDQIRERDRDPGWDPDWNPDRKPGRQETEQ